MSRRSRGRRRVHPADVPFDDYVAEAATHLGSLAPGVVVDDDWRRRLGEYHRSNVSVLSATLRLLDDIGFFDDDDVVVER